MIFNLGNRLIDEQGNVVYFTTALMELLYRGEIPAEILFPKDDPDVEIFNKLSYENFMCHYRRRTFGSCVA